MRAEAVTTFESRLLHYLNVSMSLCPESAAFCPLVDVGICEGEMINNGNYNNCRYPRSI